MIVGTMMSIAPLTAICRNSRQKLTVGTFSHWGQSVYQTNRGFSALTGSGRDVTIGRKVDLNCARSIAPIHTSTALQAKKSDELKKRIASAWSKSAAKDVWDNNTFLNRYFMEKFDLKIKHFAFFWAMAGFIGIIPDHVGAVIGMIVIFYLLKTRAFLR